VATVLLEAGADMEATYCGKTPLQLALNNENAAVERVLRQFEQRRATPQTLPAAQETGTRPSTIEASVATLEAEAAVAAEAAADSAAELEQEEQLHAETPEVGANAAAEVDRLRDELNALATILAAAGLSDEQRGEHTCVVCIDAATDHAVIPCGHVCLCSTCGPRLARTRHARCPICREPVQSLQKILYP
jgi:hypothetical protein